MKLFLKTCLLLCCCCCFSNLFAQTGSAVDKYLSNTSKLTIIGSASNNLSVPQDLDFSPIPSRKNELWVINKGDANLGGNIVIFYDAGTPTQHSEYRHDSHSAHFMLYPSAIAMGSKDSGYFGTAGEGLNSNGNTTSTFMGPVLWNSDTSFFARINQNNWVSGQPLGSHLDMLHQSPYSMGIAFDSANSYWVFDGFHNCLFHYNFETSHGYGNDDHSNGEILKYKEVKLKRIASLPSHMIVDKSSGWLYIVDNGNKRIVRVATKSGTLGVPITAPNETLQEYAEMTGVTWQTVDSGFANLSGIDYFDGRLIVGNYGTGDIRVYNTTTIQKPTYLGTIQTGDAGMMGLKIGPDSNIWYVNRTKNQVVKLTPGGVAPVAATLVSPLNTATKVPIPATMTWTKTSGATSYHLQVSMTSNFATTVLDTAGITGTSMMLPNPDNSMTYSWRVSAKNGIGEGQWSAVWSFKTMGTKPEKIVLVAPSNAAQNISLTPMVMWDSLKLSTSYDLQVATTPAFSTMIVDQNNITMPHYDLSNLSVKTTYYWRSRGVNDGATGDWSDTWSFATFDPASVKEDALAQSKLSLEEVYPNPSSTSSTVGFSLSQGQHLRISVLDVLGNEVRMLANDFYQQGHYSLSLNSTDLTSGTYYYRFISPEGVFVKAFVIRK